MIAASTAARREVVGSQQAPALETEPETLKALLDATLAWLNAAAVEPRAVITLGGPRYPRTLLDAPDPPLLIYAQGRIELLQADAIAIVGSRNPTPQGADNARAFASHLSHAGLTVVSGLALGVDAAAPRRRGQHDCGLRHRPRHRLPAAQPQPRAPHRGQRPDPQRIRARHAVDGAELRAAQSHHRRVGRRHAGGRGGAEVGLADHRAPRERGRARGGRGPGSIHSPQSHGCHARIRQGAKLVETAQDILEELRLPGATPDPAAAAPGTDPADAPLLAALGLDPVTLDALAARTGWDAAELSTRLLGASNSTAGSRGCRASCFSAWHEAEARRPARRLRRETGYP